MRVNALLEQKRVFLRSGTDSFCTVQICSGWLGQGQRRPSGVMHLNSGRLRVIIPPPSPAIRYGSALRNILETIAASKTMVFSIMAVIHAAYYGMRIYSHVTDSRLYFSAEDIPGDGLERLVCFPPTLLGPIRRLGIQKAMLGSRYPAGCVEAVFYRM